MFTNLISCQELADHLSDPNWVVIDCRFNLLDPPWGFLNYQQLHIPGAVYADLDRDLSAHAAPNTGRHPLPNPRNFVSTLSHWGIGGQTQVVVYDTSGGSPAARLWWMLKLYRHEAVAILDGGLSGWVSSGLPVSAGTEQRHPRDFPFKGIREEMIAATADVERINQDPSYLLVDAREPDRFNGIVEPIDAVAGHIPGAVNRYFKDNLTPDGFFKPIPQLKNEFTALLGKIPPQNVVVYCGSGASSCNHLAAMDAAGMKGAKLYVGSWSEWIKTHSPTND